MTTHSSNKIDGLGESYWETAKTTQPIILELVLGYLPIPVIGKELLGATGDALSKL